MALASFQDAMGEIVRVGWTIADDELAEGHDRAAALREIREAYNLMFEKLFDAGVFERKLNYCRTGVEWPYSSMPQPEPSRNYSWVSLGATFDRTDDEIIFRGYHFTPADTSSDLTGEGNRTPAPQPGVGRFISNQRLTDGRISVDIEFKSVDFPSTAEIILQIEPITEEMINVGLGAACLLNVRHWARATQKTPQETAIADYKQFHWDTLRCTGDRTTMKANQDYHLNVTVQGSFATVEVNGVEMGSGNLPFQLSDKQVGLFCQSRSDIHFRNFRVERTMPMAFVVMQLKPPEYEELFKDVIAPVCKKMNLEPFRASQTYYPGLIIADIQRQIRESRVVIAEITPVNPNVYYEVGYADAIGKPVILIADGGKLEQLPFDVRAFRTLFYENTIGGKLKVEETLTEYLKNIMNQKTWTRS
jgi:hypothetical protein